MSTFKKSKYTLAIAVNESHGPMEAIYQTMTGGFILLPGRAWSDLAGSLDARALDALAGQGFIVPADTDETAVYDLWKQQYVHDNSIIKSTVLLTRQCNLRCTYCIVEAENRTLSPATAAAMDTFYTDRIAEKRPEMVRDNYMGGEPLLNTKVLLESTARRYAFCLERHIDYGFTILTNGTLLDPEPVKILKKSGLTAVRVSLAGPGPVHDRLRVTAQNAPTYETIMTNLGKISGMTGIMVECQYDAGTDDYQKIPDMLDDMAHRGIAVEDIAFTPIFARRHDNRFDAGVGDPGILSYLNREARKRGFPMPDRAPSQSCMADLRSRFVFDTGGEIIPCPSLQGGEMAYGHVETGVNFISEVKTLGRNLPEKCTADCELLPVCNGGCRLNALVATGDFSGVDCRYDSWRDSLESYIRTQAAEALGNHVVLQEQYKEQKQAQNHEQNVA